MQSMVINKFHQLSYIHSYMHIYMCIYIYMCVCVFHLHYNIFHIYIYIYPYLCIESKEVEHQYQDFVVSLGAMAS